MDGRVEIHPSRNVPAEKGRARIERFEDDPGRTTVLERWQKAHEEWVINERPTRAALDLAGRWQRKMATGGAPPATELGNKPEKAAKGFLPQIRRCLEWHSQSWLPLEAEFQQVGFNWPAYLESMPPEVGDEAELRRLRTAIVGELEAILRARAAALRARHLRSALADWRGLLPSDGQSTAVVTQDLQQALHDELERRAATSLEQLQHRIKDLSRRLLEVTAELVEKQTWLGMIRTVSAEQRSALGAYAFFRSRLTLGGHGVRDPQNREAARREMATARSAVPLWIMPLREVAESFDPRKTRFDVVIIDEASQCDPTAMFARYLGRQAVIVGDDEQVTPTAVGQEIDAVRLVQMAIAACPPLGYH